MAHLSVRAIAVIGLLVPATWVPAAPLYEAAPFPPELAPRYDPAVDSFGWLTVKQSRSNPADPKLIRLAVVTLNALDSSGDLEPLIYLHGGPGGTGTLFGKFDLFRRLRQTRDVILLDQRGTGFSEPSLKFPPGVRSFRQLANFGNELRNSGTDPAAYNTTENAADVAELIDALGRGPAILFGHSYGSFLAQEVMRSHGASIHTVVLGGVLPPENEFIPTFEQNSRDGLRAFFRDVQRTPRARRKFRNLERRFFRLLSSLRSRPLKVARSALVPKAYRLRADAFYSDMVGLLQTPDTIRLIPLIIAELEAGRTRWAGQFFVPRSAATLRLTSSPGMYYSVLGSDFASPGWDLRAFQGLNRLRPAVLASVVSPGIGGILRATTVWGVPYNPRATRNPLFSDIPTLLVNGRFEAQTPPDGGDVVASRLSRVVNLTFPRSGHGIGFENDPALDAILQFVANPGVAPVVNLATLESPGFYARRIPRRTPVSIPERLDPPRLPAPFGY